MVRVALSRIRLNTILDRLIDCITVYLSKVLLDSDMAWHQNCSQVSPLASHENLFDALRKACHLALVGNDTVSTRRTAKLLKRLKSIGLVLHASLAVSQQTFLMEQIYILYKNELVVHRTKAGQSHELFLGFKWLSTKGAVRIKVAILEPLQISFHTTLQNQWYS